MMRRLLLMKGTLLHRAWYGLVWLLTLLFLFYSVEGWRGKRAWREYEQRMRHQGEWEAWKDLLPVPVPASNNVMATPVSYTHLTLPTTERV